MKQILLIVTLLLISLPSWAHNKIKVACVGNSVTYGYNLPNRETQAYPVQLQQMLGKDYDVRNFGHSGATLLYKGHNPYVKLPEFKAAIKYKADIVVIHLGLNDTDPRNWPHYADEFIPNYRALIDSFRVANPNSKIWICLMTPIFHNHPRFDSGTRLWHSMIQQRIQQIAHTYNVGLIDLYTPLHPYPNLFPDALHPDTEGANILAKTVYSNITGNFGGLTLPATYGSEMVIQRQSPITFHGKANVGEEVNVNFHGLKAQAITNDQGQWSATFPAEEAGGPYQLSFKAKSDKRTFNNVYVGEVWLCSGQSNMELVIPRTTTAQADLAAADTCSRLHLYNMPSIIPTYAIEWDSTRLDSVNHLLYVQAGVWERSNTKAAQKFSSIAFNYGRLLADSLGCHVGIISNAVGGSGCENWIDRSTLEEFFPAILRNWKQNDFIMRWMRDRAALNTKHTQSKHQRHPYEPAYLFESAILPLERYNIRGVLWYQGESNAENVEVHERLFPLLEKSWRKYFNQASLPFYTVQLSSIATRPSWPHFRDSQRQLAEADDNTWMTVCSDLGDSLDVHPRQKWQVAYRLALSALCNTYHHNIVGSGPRYTHFEANGTNTTLYFTEAQNMHPANGNHIIGFEVADEDGIYYPAEAIVKGTTITLHSNKKKNVKAVRYGWQPFTHANLINGAGLPASTFRDEKFEIKQQ